MPMAITWDGGVRCVEGVGRVTKEGPSAEVLSSQGFVGPDAAWQVPNAEAWMSVVGVVEVSSAKARLVFRGSPPRVQLRPVRGGPRGGRSRYGSVGARRGVDGFVSEGREGAKVGPCLRRWNSESIDTVFVWTV